MVPEQSQAPNRISSGGGASGHASPANHAHVHAHRHYDTEHAREAGAVNAFTPLLHAHQPRGSNSVPVHQQQHGYGVYTSYGTIPRYWRLFQRWEGNNIFLWDGRLIVGSNPGCLLITLSIIVATPILFSLYVGHYLHTGYQVLNYVLACILLFFLLRTALADPGILPRSPHMPPYPLPPLRDEHEEADGTPVKLCPFCNFYRPPRARHCRFCNNCVQEFDHHCPWVGTCIGYRNYRWFLICLLFASIYSLMVSILSTRVFLRIVRGVLRIPYPLRPSYYDAFKMGLDQRFAAFCLALFGAAVFAFGLVPQILYQLKLLMIGQTTNEHVRNRFGGRASPYNQGFCRNLQRVMFEPLAPPRLDLRVWVDERGKPVAPAEVEDPVGYVIAVQKAQELNLEPPYPEPPRHWTDLDSDEYEDSYSDASAI